MARRKVLGVVALTLTIKRIKQKKEEYKDLALLSEVQMKIWICLLSILLISLLLVGYLGSGGKSKTPKLSSFSP